MTVERFQSTVMASKRSDSLLNNSFKKAFFKFEVFLCILKTLTSNTHEQFMLQQTGTFMQTSDHGVQRVAAGSSYRSRPPFGRWLPGTEAPGPPSSGRYEPPGGED